MASANQKKKDNMIVTRSNRDVAHLARPARPARPATKVTPSDCVTKVTHQVYEKQASSDGKYVKEKVQLTTKHTVHKAPKVTCEEYKKQTSIGGKVVKREKVKAITIQNSSTTTVTMKHAEKISKLK